MAIEWAKAEIARKKPDAVAITGDLTMRARHREFEAATKWINSLDVPVTVEVGNHDMPYFNLFERFTDPYRRFRGMQDNVEAEIDLPGLAIVSLNTAPRAQWRWPWSYGYVTDHQLAKALKAIDELPAGMKVVVACHHPLVEAGTRGKALTKGGDNALAELAKRNVVAVLSGHVHDAFDMTAKTDNGPVRMIGAGTLSQRVRSTPPSFNELHWDGTDLKVVVRNLEEVPTRDMQIDDVPEDAMPPRKSGEPVAPVGRVPAEDPPVH